MPQIPGYPADSPFQIFNAGLHTFRANFGAVGRVGGRALIFLAYRPLAGGLAEIPVDRVPKIITAPGRMTLGRSPGYAIAPFIPGCTPVVDDFPDTLSTARTGLFTPVGSGRFRVTLGALRLRFGRLRASLLGQ